MGYSMSQISEAAELAYPDKPDANGYAKKYYKRRAFYFGPHNSPESFLLFGEWKRRLIASGEPPEVKQVRKELAHQALPTPHRPPQPAGREKPLQYALSVSVAAAALLLWAAIHRLSRPPATAPTVDGITLSNEEIDFIRGIRRQEFEFAAEQQNNGNETANLLHELLKEGPQNAEKYLHN